MEKEKNKISTGTLTYEDIHNKAEYEAGSTGVNIDTGKDAEDNEAGVTPNIGMPAEDKAESDTKATIAEGEIEIRDKDKQKQDLKDLNRDTRNSLNKLGEIFDKTKVEEKQEFAGLFQEVAHSYIGDLIGKLSSEEKAVLNSLVDGLVAEWTSGNFLAGASGTALLESMQSAINEIKDPALKQIAAGMIGAVAGEIAGGNAQAGASGAVSTEKYNEMMHKQVKNKMDLIDKVWSDNSLTKAEKEEKINQIESISKIIDESQQEVLDKYGYKHWEEVPAGQLDNLLKESDQLVQDKNAFNYLKSIGLNATTTIADLPLNMAGKAQLFGMGVWSAGSVIVNLNQDFKEYSGVDYIIASSIDVAAPVMSYIYGAVEGGNKSTSVVKDPISNMTKIVIGGISYGVLSEFVADYLKKTYAETDVNKIYNNIKGEY